MLSPQAPQWRVAGVLCFYILFEKFFLLVRISVSAKLLEKLDQYRQRAREG